MINKFRYRKPQQQQAKDCRNGHADQGESGVLDAKEKKRLKVSYAMGEQRAVCVWSSVAEERDVEVTLLLEGLLHAFLLLRCRYAN